MFVLDENVVRERLRQVRNALAKLDQEREVLVAMLNADERWLSWSAKTSAATPPFPGAVPLTKHEEPGERKGPSLMQAALEVLGDAHGAPLHAREIWKRAQERGATTSADSPLAAMDFALFNLAKKQQIEKVGPRTYRIAVPPAPTRAELQQMQRNHAALFPSNTDLL